MVSDRRAGRPSTDSVAPAVNGEIEISPQISARRSRVAIIVPVALAAATIIVSEILIVLGHAPVDLGTFGLAAGLAVFIPLLGSFEGITGWNNHVDQQPMRLTRKTWTGTRTVDLNCLVRVRRVRLRYPSNGTTSLRGPRPFDCLLLTDRHGARLSVRDKPKGLASRVLPKDDAALALVRKALSQQGTSGGQQASVSRFAAIALQRTEDSVSFRLRRAGLLWAAGLGGGWCLAWLLIVGIPKLA